MTATTDWNANTIAVLAPCSSKPSGVELRGLEPLAPSWRTRAMAVRQASLSMDLGAQRRESPPGEDSGVAVPSCWGEEAPLVLVSSPFGQRVLSV